MPRMHKVVDPLCVAATLLMIVSLCLGKFVVVMREAQIFAACVYVHLLPYDAAGHGRAFNVPPCNLRAHVRKIRHHVIRPAVSASYTAADIPGLPLPQGDCQLGSPGFAAFQRAKSFGFRFSCVTKFASPSAASTVEPAAHGFSFGYR